MKYTSQHCCDKAVDGKMAYLANAVFRVVQNHGEQSYTFVGFKEGDCPAAAAPPQGPALACEVRFCD